MSGRPAAAPSFGSLPTEVEAGYHREINHHQRPLMGELSIRRRDVRRGLASDMAPGVFAAAVLAGLSESCAAGGNGDRRSTTSLPPESRLLGNGTALEATDVEIALPRGRRQAC